MFESTESENAGPSDAKYKVTLKINESEVGGTEAIECMQREQRILRTCLVMVAVWAAGTWKRNLCWGHI
jgi:hypothetical protein